MTRMTNISLNTPVFGASPERKIPKQILERGRTSTKSSSPPLRTTSSERRRQELYAIPENPLPKLYQQVRNAVRRFGRDKTVRPKGGDPSTGRGLYQAEIQAAMKSAKEVINERSSEEIDRTIIPALKTIVEEEVPGVNPPKIWFSRQVGGLNLTKDGFFRSIYHTTNREKEILPQNIQENAQQINRQASEKVSQQPNLKPKLEKANWDHRQRLYDFKRRVRLNPQEAQSESQLYILSEQQRQMDINRYVLEPVN